MQPPPSVSDFAQCADEPIRTPGAIQPHGRLVVLGGDRRIVAYSANWPNVAAAREAVAPLLSALERLSIDESPAPVGRVMCDGVAFDASAHRGDRLMVVEFEPHPADDADTAPVYTLTRRLLLKMQAAHSVADVAAIAAEEIRALTGFGRSVVYRFDEHGHGEVLAEEREDGYDSYAGHHFPAADIPSQARALYLLNHLRMIPDATYTPVPLLAGEAGELPAPLDLSFAALRSVSPIHLEYMRNMGTLASMSVSIVVGGQLWGLISCHNHAPRLLSLPARVACEHLGRLVSLQIGAMEDRTSVAAQLELRRRALDLVAGLTEADATLRQLLSQPQVLAAVGGAGGCAVVLDDECWTLGSTPPEREVQALSRWIARQDEAVFAHGELSAVYPPAAAFTAEAAGVLALSISQHHRHHILWFRPEVVETIRWAGDPHKPMRASDGRLHPRKSFESWQEQVRGRSAPWRAAEVAAGHELRQALIGIVLRRAEEVAEFATELGRLNKELEAFSYTVSHDLRAPMRHIAGYVDLVLDSEGEALDARSRRYLGNVKDAAAFAGQLVDALLDFSRMGRSEIHRRPVDLRLLVAELARELQQHERDRAIEWDIAADLPQVLADPTLLQITVRNLMSNALKYTQGREPARIAVSAARRDDGEGLEIRDNGVGFDMKYANKLFGVFQRLHQADEFEGTGIGLASVRRIVERHGGQVWAHGEIGVGARFGFVLPRTVPTRGAAGAPAPTFSSSNDSNNSNKA